MSDEQRESRINIEDLHQKEQELTPEESKEVQGGSDGQTRLLVGQDQGVYGLGGASGHVKVIDSTRLG